jgi:subfamily B ATP-binding cassette protein MsbA
VEPEGTSTGKIKKSGNKDSLFRLVSYVKPYWQYILGAGATTGATTALDLLQPWVIGFLLVDKVIKHSDLTLLPWVVGLLTLGFVGKEITGYFQTSFTEILSQKTVHKLRHDLYHHMEQLPVRFFDNSRIGELVSRIVSDTDEVEKMMTQGISSIGANLAMTIGTAVLLFYIDPRLAAMILPITVVVVIAVHLFKKSIKRSSRNIREVVGDLAARTYEVLSGIRTVKSLSMEKSEAQKFREKSLAIGKAKVQLARLSWLYQASVDLLTLLSIVIVIVFAAPWVVSGVLALGALIAFLGYVDKLFKSITNITKANFSVQRALAAGERIFEIIDIEPESEDQESDLVEPPTIKGSIQFDEVSFDYGQGKRVLDKLSLTIKQGETLAIVGRSGAGKSTIINLLLRFYKPSDGRILIDGHDISAWKLSSLRQRIAVVPQEPVLFSESIRNNIAYGNSEASLDEIIKASKDANAHEFIMAFLDGYETEIGERGAKLSNGQRQRLAIARALLRNPSILVLDEATSNIDSQSESLIQDSLRSLAREKTIIIVAHRLSTVMISDRIVVLESGRLVEMGTHNELLQKRGPYTELYEAQINP